VGKYDEWNRFFETLEGDGVEVAIDFLEETLEGPLPASARKWPSWWSTSSYYAVWAPHGWRASPQLDRGVVVFRRARQPRRDMAPPRSFGADVEADLILVGCTKTKGRVAAPAKDLFISALFNKRRRYAETTGKPWYVLSAAHGLVAPDEVIDPYDVSLASATADEVRAWADRVAPQIIAIAADRNAEVIEVHAGAAYMPGHLMARLGHAGLHVRRPLSHLTRGEQLGWYERVREAPPPPAEAATPDTAAPPRPVLVSAGLLGPFEFSWPDAVETFEHGWEGEVEVGERRIRFRHGVGRRTVYGAERLHTVTWLDGQPAVEGVAADDYATSFALLSRIKRPDGTVARHTSEMPRGYHQFVVVDHRDEIDALYSPHCLAVKIREDDLVGWMQHALLRRAAASPAQRDAPSLDVHEPAVDEATQRRVVDGLLAFPAEPPATPAEAGILEFTPDHEANALIAHDPFAFLLAVIADQGIQAERAWAVPYAVAQRIGHLDPAGMVAEPDQVEAAFAQPPALHRDIDKVPRWFVAAADRVLADYGGDAGRIWGDEPTATDLRRRLEAFDGIGQKKAAMAVEILERDMGVAIRDLHGSDIAYDVHVRRVFLRTGLAERDDLDLMVAVARRLHPQRPGALDFPAWEVGRTWCHPGVPDCGACVLGAVCPKLVDRASGVRGA
jgi:uncharacterized HhH-GPD family protein